MQTVTFDITAKPPASLVLWRAIPATVTLTGLGDTSGDWKCIVTADTWDDATLLTGEVTAGTAPGALTVTFAAMDSEPLTAAIKRSATLSCVVTLTDTVSRVLLIPLCIRNRATDVQPPPPPSQTYVNSINGETGDVTLGASDVGALPATTTAADIGALPTDTTAADVKAVSLDGLELAELSSGVIPSPGKIYTLAPSTDVEITFPAPVSGMTNAFRLRIAMPDPAVAVTWPAGIVWRFAIPTLAAGTTSELAFAWTGSVWEGWATPDMSEYLPKHYTITSPESIQFTGYNSNPILMVTHNTIALGFTATTDGIISGTSVGAYCNAGGLATVVGISCRYGGVNLNGSAMGVGCYANSANKSVYGRYNIPPTSDVMISLGCGADANNRDDAWRVLTDKTFEVMQKAVFDEEVTFTPAGGSATTLSAIIARIEALEQAIQ